MLLQINYVNDKSEQVGQPTCYEMSNIRKVASMVDVNNINPKYYPSQVKQEFLNAVKDSYNDSEIEETTQEAKDVLAKQDLSINEEYDMLTNGLQGTGINRSEILQYSGDAINGSRRRNYGKPENSFEEIAIMWSVIFRVDISAQQVALAMNALKIVRANTNPLHLDNYVDMAGYAAIAGELGLK